MSRPRPPIRSGNSPGASIYLLRHGAVQSQMGGKRFIGCQDIPLNSTGFQQAAAWADYFKGTGLQEIYCSDLIRCRVTADIISAPFSIEPLAFAQLREICLGEWEGRTFEDVQALHPQEFKARGDHLADYRPAGGESFRDLQNRTWPVFEDVVRGLHTRALIVTHAGVIRVLLCRLLGMPLESLFTFGQSYGALTIIDVRPEGYGVQGLNIQLSQHVPSV